MSLLGNIKKTVINAQNAANSSIYLGYPAVVLNGVNYQTIVCSPVSAPLVNGSFVALTNAATGEPINIKGKMILYAIFEAQQEMIATNSTTYLELVSLKSPTDFNDFISIYNSSPNMDDINNKFLSEESDVSESGYYLTNDTNFYLGLNVTGTGDVTSGTFVLTLQLSSW